MLCEPTDKHNDLDMINTVWQECYPHCRCCCLCWHMKDQTGVNGSKTKPPCQLKNHLTRLRKSLCHSVTLTSLWPSNMEKLSTQYEYHSTWFKAGCSEQETKHLPFSENKIPLFKDRLVPVQSKRRLQAVRRLKMRHHRDFSELSRGRGETFKSLNPLSVFSLQYIKHKHLKSEKISVIRLHYGFICYQNSCWSTVNTPEHSLSYVYISLFRICILNEWKMIMQTYL